MRAGVVSYGLSSYGYDIRVADEFKVFTNVNNALIDPKNFDPRSFVDIKSDTVIVPPNSFALGPDDRVLPHPARRAHGLPRQVHLRALRHHRQCDAVRAGMGGHRDAGDLQHHAAARQGLRQRGHRAGAVLPERRALRDFATPTRRASTSASRKSRCRESNRGCASPRSARPSKTIELESLRRRTREPPNREPALAHLDASVEHRERVFRRRGDRQIDHA